MRLIPVINESAPRSMPWKEWAITLPLLFLFCRPKNRARKGAVQSVKCNPKPGERFRGDTTATSEKPSPAPVTIKKLQRTALRISIFEIEASEPTEYQNELPEKLAPEPCAPHGGIRREGKSN